MDFQQNEFDRILFFEHARKTAEAEYAKNPLDADVSLQFFPIFFHFFFKFSIFILWNYERFQLYYHGSVHDYFDWYHGSVHDYFVYMGVLLLVYFPEKNLIFCWFSIDIDEFSLILFIIFGILFGVYEWVW